MSLLDSLINISINISSAAPNLDSFSNLLIVGKAPEGTSSNPPADVAAYSSISEVSAAGWAQTEEVYKAASVAFANGAAKIYIAVNKVVSGTAEDISVTLTRAAGFPDWYGIAPAGILESAYPDIATWTDANHKLFGFTSKETENPVPTTYLGTYGIYIKDDQTTGHTLDIYTSLALMARCFAYTPGEETWAYKTLSIVSPQILTAAEINDAEDAGYNVYVNCAGRNITLNGKTVNGEWIDIVRGKDWLKSDMQNRLYNLFTMNPKVPYTSAGIALIENQMTASLKQGQAQGLVADDEFDETGNRVPGYTVTVPDMADVSDAARSSRTLSGCKFTARLAGAIHLINVTGTLVEHGGE